MPEFLDKNIISEIDLICLLIPFSGKSLASPRLMSWCYMARLLYLHDSKILPFSKSSYTLSWDPLILRLNSQALLALLQRCLSNLLHQAIKCLNLFLQLHTFQFICIITYLIHLSKTPWNFLKARNLSVEFTGFPSGYCSIYLLNENVRIMCKRQKCVLS